MSSKAIIVCDRCGEEFSKDAARIETYLYGYNYKSESLTVPKSYDLCINCALKFAAFMAEPSIIEAKKRDPFWITDDCAKNIIKELYL